MNEILVIGHKNPDTDAICSAIGYAEFKRRTDMPEAQAARCGDLNDRIKFVLNTFKVAPPRFVTDVSPKVGDVMQKNVISALSETTVAEAVGVMDERNIRVLPILDREQKCRGLVSVFKMSQFFFPAPNRLFDSRRVLASVSNLGFALNGKLLHTVDPDRERDLTMVIGGMSLEHFSRRVPKYDPSKVLVIVGDRTEIQDLAVKAGIDTLVVTGGLEIEPQVLELARATGTNVISSPHDTATTAMLCRAAVKVDHVSDEHFLSFHEDERLSDIKNITVESAFQAFPVLDDDGKVTGILSKSDLLKKVNRKLILVDHNELTQAVQGASEVEIIEVIDHHRIGTLTTREPILFRNEPVGSTSSIVADCFFRYQIELPPPIAGLLLAGLVSDTLNLTSPTTTERDSQILQKLERITGIKAAEFTEQLFASGSVLVSRPPELAVVSDCKEYKERDHVFSVAQIEEIGFENFKKLKGSVVAALEKYRKDNNYFFSTLLVTDVVKQTSLLLLSAPAEFHRLIDYPEKEPGIYELKGVVSRKKQLIPFLTHCMEHYRPQNSEEAS